MQDSRISGIYSPLQLGYAYRQRGRGFSLTPWLRKAGSIIGPALTNWSAGEAPGTAIKNAIFKKKNIKKKSKKTSKAKRARGGKRGFKQIKL
jgi:hypothetical protein